MPYPAEFIHDNLAIQANVINMTYENKVKRLLFVGSSCIYPELAHQPMKEECLITGLLEETNRRYALAKIAGIEMCWSYNQQYGTQYFAVMPTNLYGQGDNFGLNNSHMLPALTRKFHDEAKRHNNPTVTAWGTGITRREFLFCDDMADACMFIMCQADKQFNPLLATDRNDGLSLVVNIGVGVDITIRDLTELVKNIVAYEGEVTFDPCKSDGESRKLMNVERFTAMGWDATTTLKQGIELAYQDFQARELC